MLYLGPLAFFGAYLYARATDAPEAWRKMLGAVSAALFVLAYIGSALGTEQLDGRLKFVITMGLLGVLVVIYRKGLRALRRRIAPPVVAQNTSTPSLAVIPQDTALAQDVAVLAAEDGVAPPPAPFSLLKRDQEGNIQATCRAQLDGPLVCLSGLWVAPTMRRKGEGRGLVTALLEEARTRGAEHATATTSTHEAAAFLEALGFSKLLEVPKSAPERITWERRL